MIQRLDHIALRAADPQAAATFATEKMGFSLAHVGEDGSHYLKAHGIDPFSLVYTPGDTPGLDHVAYLVEDEGALAVAADRLEQAGVEVSRVDAGEFHHAPGIQFRTPAGHRIELTTGIHTDLPVAAIAPVPDGAPAPVVCDHIGLGAPDFEAEEQFLVETLGLLRSNRVMAPDGTQVMGFLRAPERYLYHCVVVARGPEAAMHHYQCTLKNVDSFYATYEALKANGVDVEWGPLRHGPGHNIAMYFRDGAGYWVEYSVEEEIILDDTTYVPRTWTVTDPHVVDEWQTGAPPPALMGPPPEPPQPENVEALREEVMGRVAKMLNTVLYVGISKVNMSQGPPPFDVIHAHLQYALQLEEQGVLFAAGPFVDDEGAMVGDGMFVVRAESNAAAKAILDKDPIHAGGFRKCQVYGWALHEGRVNLSVNISDKTWKLA